MIGAQELWIMIGVLFVGCAVVYFIERGDWR